MQPYWFLATSEMTPESDDGRMQAFSLSTGIGPVGCNELPDSGIVVHTPDGAGTVDFTINGVDISMGSTLYLRAEKEMRIAVLEGEATVTSDGITETVEAGEYSSMPIDPDGKGYITTITTSKLQGRRYSWFTPSIIAVRN